MSMRKRQLNEPWNLRALRNDSCHDDGTPLTLGEKTELDGFISELEDKLA